eukprot:g910.t1
MPPRRLSLKLLESMQAPETTPKKGEDNEDGDGLSVVSTASLSVNEEEVNALLADADVCSRLQPIFQHYCSLGDTFNLERLHRSNFIKLLRESKIVEVASVSVSASATVAEDGASQVRNASLNETRADLIFTRCTRGNRAASPRSPTSSATSLEFNMFLMALSLCASAMETSLDQLVEEHVIPRAKSLPELPPAEVLLEDAVVAELRGERQMIAEVFKHYASQDEHEAGLGHDELNALMSDFSITPKIVTKAELFRLWWHVSEGQKAIDFADFLEIIGRAAIVGFGKPFLEGEYPTTASRVAAFFEWMRNSGNLSNIREQERQLGHATPRKAESQKRGNSRNKGSILVDNSSHPVTDDGSAFSAGATSIFGPQWEVEDSMLSVLSVLDPYMDDLHEIFEYYCFMGNRASLNFTKLNATNWAKLVRDCGLVRQRLAKAGTVDVVFARSTTVGKHGTLSFMRFLHALTYLSGSIGARMRKVGALPEDAQGLIDLAVDRDEAVATAHNSADHRAKMASLAEFLILLVVHVVLPNASRVTCFGYGKQRDNEVRRMLQMPSVKSIIDSSGCGSLLTRTFAFYAELRETKLHVIKNEREKIAGMSFREVQAFAQDFGLVPPRSALLTLPEIFMCFRACRTEPDERPDLITFPEWKVFFARAAMVAFSKPSLVGEHPEAPQKIHGFIGWCRSTDGLKKIGEREWAMGHGHKGLVMTPAVIAGNGEGGISKVKGANGLGKGASTLNTVMDKVRRLSISKSSSSGLDLRRVFERFDADKNGTVDREEFAKAIQEICNTNDGSEEEGVSMDEIDHLFSLFDSDRDEVITYSEFVYQFYNRRAVAKRMEGLSSSTEENAEDAKAEDAQQLEEEPIRHRSTSSLQHGGRERPKNANMEVRTKKTLITLKIYRTEPSKLQNIGKRKQPAFLQKQPES